MIPMTAELAQICLEAEEIKLYSSSPDRQFSFTIRFSLVDENGRPYTSLKGVAAPKPHGQAAAQYQLRRSRAAERRRAEDERTFCLFTSLPASLAGADDERIATARVAIRTKIREHFQRAAIRTANAKTKGGREIGADQFFITPTDELMPQQYVHLGPLPATGLDTAPTGQPPLHSLRCLGVGAPEDQPALVRPSPQLRSMLQIKGCCMRRSCVPGSRDRTCNIFDIYYGMHRRPRQESDGAREFREHQATKVRKRKRREMLRQTEEEHVTAQHQATMGDGQDRCRSWELGRCRRFTGAHAAQRHGSEDETMIITCCSKRSEGDEGYSALFLTCPFAFSEEKCPYMGHEDDTMAQ